MILGLPEVHNAKALDRPEKVSLGQNAAVPAVFIENRQGGIAGVFHTFHRLTQGAAVVDIRAQRLRCQEK